MTKKCKNHLRFEKALEQYDFEEAMWLIDCGDVPVDYKVQGDETLILKACGSGEMSCVEAALEHGSDVNQCNSSGRTPLMKAAGGGHVEIVKLLLNLKEIDVMKTDSTNKTALDWARLARYEDCTELIQSRIHKRITIEREIESSGQRLQNLQNEIFAANAGLTVIMLEKVKENALGEIEKLVRISKLTRRTFDRAVREYNILVKTAPAEQVKKMKNINLVFYINATLPGGVSAIMRACAESREDLVEFLILRGADISNQTTMLRGHSALTWAAACGNLNVVRVLVSRGADIFFSTESEGKTALIHAVENGHVQVVMALADIALDKSMERHRDSIIAQGRSVRNVDGIRSLTDWSEYFESFILHKDLKGRDAMSYATRQGLGDAIDILGDAIERISNRKSRLETENKACELMFCPLGCGLEGTTDRIKRHVEWECGNRIIQCEKLCGEELPASELDYHLEKKCKFRMVYCKYAYRGCPEYLPQMDMETHEQHKCKWRESVCRLGCGESMNYDDLVHHETTKCPERLIECQKCKLIVKSKAYPVHQKYSCDYRLVACRIGCGTMIPLNILSDHETNECQKPCALGCGQVIGPKDKREIHERHCCPQRLVRCRFECSTGQIQAQHKEYHENDECERRIVSCPLHCGEYIEHQYIDAHTLDERGTCVLRKLPCLLDYVGRHIRVRVTESSEPTVAFVEKYDQSSGKHTVRISGQPGDYALGKDLWHSEPLDVASWTCGLMSENMRHQHLATKCKKRKFECENGCGQVMQEEALQRHYETGCDKRVAKCSNPGCKVQLRWCDLWEHETSTCPHKSISCTCGLVIQKAFLENHQRVSCEDSRIRCVLGCSTYVARRLMDEHVLNQCPKREVGCKLGCGISKMWACEVETHEKSECPARTVSCPRCAQSMRSDILGGHLSLECDLRDEICVCGEIVIFRELAQHQSMVCSKRLRWCPLGCGERFADEAIQTHEENACKKRVVPCRMGCGAYMRLDHCDDHELRECTKREVACDLLCGDVMRYESLEVHKSTCMHRKIPCGAGHAGCTRQLRSWFTGDIAKDQGRPIYCEAHKETGLSYVASIGDVPVCTWMLQVCSKSEDGDSQVKIQKILTSEGLSGQSCLTLAAGGGHLRVLQLFSEWHVDWNTETSRGRSPILEAVRNRHFQVVEYLLDCGVSATHRSLRGMDPTSLAKRLGDTKLTRLLEDHTRLVVDTNRLFRAISLSTTTQIETMLEYGQAFDVVAYNRMFAIRNSLDAKIEFLVEKLDEASATARIRSEMEEKRFQEQALLNEIGEHHKTSREHPATLHYKLQKIQEHIQMLEKREIDERVAREAYRRDLKHREQELHDIREKIHCARLLCTRSASGHTALSWAAMYGNPEIIGLLLECGSSVEYDVDQYLIAIQLIQSTIRNYLKKKRDSRWNAANSLRARLEAMIRSLHLKSVATRQRNMRIQARSPFAVAVFNGHEEAKQILLRAGAHVFRRTYSAFPSPIPYRYPCTAILRGAVNPVPGVWGDGQYTDETMMDSQEDYEGSGRHRMATVVYPPMPVVREQVFDSLRAAYDGVKHRSADTWVHGQGWVAYSRYHEMLDSMTRQWQESIYRSDMLGEASHQNWKRRRENKKRAVFNAELAKCIREENFMKLLDFVEQGAAIDYQTEEGHTALTYASSYGIRCINKDGDDVLVVEMLLDRESHIPNVNFATRLNQTALSFAASAGRLDVMEALVSRGANVNQIFPDGRTALMYAIIAGRSESFEYLLRHGASADPTDHSGKSAVDYARIFNHIEMQRRVAGLRSNYGVAVESAHAEQMKVQCAWGCGKSVIPHEWYLKFKHEGNDVVDDGDETGHVEDDGDESRITMEDDAEYHEEQMCPKRYVECPFGCGVTMLWFEELESHQKESCPNRPLPCIQKCGTLVPLNEMDVHATKMCGLREVRCLRCDDVVVFQNLEGHQRAECKWREMPCEYECGSFVPHFLYTEHLRKHCPNREVTCGNAKCTVSMQAKILEVHMQVHCPYRVVQCTWGCKDGCIFIDRTVHESTLCPNRQVPCPNHCKEYVVANELDLHLQTTCKRRFVPCTLACGMKVPEADMTRHLNTECKNRVIECENEGCDLQLRWEEWHEVHSKECKRRPIACALGCGQKVALADLELHKKNSCGRRLILCSMGCTMKIPKDELEQHETHDCRKRTTWCSRGCNAILTADKKNAHEKRECPMRPVMCSLGCGEEMKAMDLKYHEENQCIRRM